MGLLDLGSCIHVKLAWERKHSFTTYIPTGTSIHPWDLNKPNIASFFQGAI